MDLVSINRRTAAIVAILAVSLIADSGAGLHWTPPPNWKAEGPRPMRLATYTIPAAAGDTESGQCLVNYFGQGQGGSIEANMDRWIGQFVQPNGKPSKDVAKQEKRTVHGMKVSTVDISGGFTGMGGPQMAAGAPKPGYRLLGAIVEGPQGSVFFKFTGPAKTVAQNQAEFDKMLSTLSAQ